MNTIRESSFGKYEGYHETLYDGYMRTSQYITLKSGLKLASDFYFPTKNGRKAEEAFPVILLYTPYGRRKYTGETVNGERISVINENFDIPGLTAYGYVAAVVECRGTGASFGVRRVVNSREEAADGKEVIEWLAKQPFCDGKVGTVGSSYKGQTQLEVISMRPEPLKASFIGCTDYNKYDGWVRGGIPRAFGSQPDTDWGNTPEEIQASIDRVVEMTVPVDEDPDRILLRQAVAGHVDCGKQIPMMRDLNWRNSILPEIDAEVWNVLSASSYKDEINASGVAVYLAGGTYDVFRRDTFIIYQNLTLPKKLTLGPWYHTVKKLEPAWETEILRWFDYWLKGIDNGIMEEDPYSIRVANYNFASGCYLGEGTGYYRFEKEWPLHAGTRRTFFLSPEKPEKECGIAPVVGSLKEEKGTETASDYTAVYGIKTSKESRLTTEESGMGVDQQGMVYTGSPFQEDTVFIGHPMAHLTFSLEEPGWMEDHFDTDIFLTVSDYDPETGLAFEITDGHLRASLRASKENPYYDFMGLPWHENNIGDNEYLKLHEKTSLDIDLMPLSYCI